MNQPGAWSVEPEAASRDETAPLRRAMASMAATFEDLATGIRASAGERCPYRSARNLCTFDGGCQNQRRAAHGGAVARACGGDERLCWEPSSNSLEAGAWGLELEAGSREPGAGGLERVP